MAISLDSIKRGVRMKAPKIIVYGVGGIGKTDFAAGAPSPVFLFTEEGQGLLDVPRFELRPNDPIIRSWAEINACVDVLMAQDHSYSTLVIDTIDFAEPMLWQHTCAFVPHEKGFQVKNIEDYGFGKGYVHAVDQARPFLQKLDDLRTRRNMAIVLLAHCATKRFDPPDGESYERYMPKLQERLAQVIYDWSDACLFASYETHVTKDKEGFQSERRRAIGTGDRVLYAQERPAWWAKNRYSLPFKMPFIKGRSWSDFVAAIQSSAAASAPAPAVAQPVTESPTEEPATAKEN